MSEHDTTTGDQDSSTEDRAVPATVTSDGERVVVVTPDGMGVAHHDEQPGQHSSGYENRHVRSPIAGREGMTERHWFQSARSAR